jgi:heme/copper-type cytochrome/quinol oxidase subunit 1
MTVTEAPRDVQDAAAVDTEPVSPTGLAALVGSGDPRSIGKLYVGTSLLFLLVAGVTGLLVGLEQVDVDKPDNVLGTDVLAQVFTLHSIGGLFLVVLPLLLGLALAVVPLQVGASTVAFPRAAAASYWVFLVGGGLLLASYAVNGGPFGGEAEGVALFVAAFVTVLVALSTAAVCVATTVVALRAPGMSLRRTPLFSWSMLVAGTLWLLTLPVLAGVMVLAYVDLEYGVGFLGGPGGLYNRILWVFWQPTVYAFAIPALGIIADIVPVFAQRRLKRHGGAMFLIGAFGALSFGAWAQVGLSTFDGEAETLPWLHELPWIAVSVAIVVPVLGLLGLWSSTLGAGRVKMASPLLFAVGSGAMLLVGAAAGIATAVEDFNLVLTTWQSAQAYLVLLAALAAGFAGLAFWAPKLYGNLLPENTARLTATLLPIGAFVLAVPYAIAGVLDQPRLLGANEAAIGAIEEVGTVETLNLISAVGGAVVVAAGVLGILAVLGARASRRQGPGDDPWNGHTLEWATSSPPPVGNFAGLPEITSEAPLYDARHGALRDTTEASA